MSDEVRQPAGPPDRAKAGRGAGPPGFLSLDQGFDAGSLYALRAAVAAHAAAAGLSPQRVYDVVAAAHELAANSVVHGPGHGRLRLWAADGFLYCQVSDDGHAESAAAPNTAEAGVAWRTKHGHGMWVVDRVADQIGVDRGRSGTTITASFAITPPA
jgi:anti-sigma regulatory factor (Ser/Thr protein kinase)